MDNDTLLFSSWDYKPWSNTGHLKKDQPDNAEFGINKWGDFHDIWSEVAVE